MPLTGNRAEHTPATSVLAAGTGADIRLHASGNANLPDLAAGAYFEIRGSGRMENDGLYRVVSVGSPREDYQVDKLTGAAPVARPDGSPLTILLFD